jgi:hypothetical protein
MSGPTPEGPRQQATWPISSEYISAAFGAPSGLTDAERLLLSHLAVATVAGQLGARYEDAAAALKELADRGDVRITGDANDVYLTASGHSIVHAERRWLRAHAAPRELN